MLLLLLLLLTLPSHLLHWHSILQQPHHAAASQHQLARPVALKRGATRQRLRQLRKTTISS
jgi:hypothetical protein